MALRNYSNLAPPVTLTSDVATSATDIPVPSTAGYPPTPFLGAMARGTTDEEVVLVTGATATVFTVVRGYDGTTPHDHPSGTSFEHTVSAIEWREANAHVNDASSHPPVGGVMFTADDVAPPGWLLCNGAAVSRTTYAALFALLGTIYGAGDGASTFNLPDLRGRAVIGAGQGVGLTNRSLGDLPGAETHTLTVAQMPSHAHGTATTSTDSHDHGDTDSAGSHTHPPQQSTLWFAIEATTGPYYTAAAGNKAVSFSSGTGSAGAHIHNIPSDSHSHTVTVGSTGSGAAHNNMQPSIALNAIIKT